ncbi:MAG: glycosyltransferase [Chloroflexi bacterium]|nr:glycosyltransferase [Chloroflexota bacterium]
MNILFIVPYTPTLVRTRPYNLTRALAQRGNTVTLATLWENETERAALRGFSAEGIRVIAEPLTRLQTALNLPGAWLRGQPLQSLYCWQPALAQRLVAEMPQARWDVAHIEHLRGAEYGIYLRRFARATELPMVWDSVDCISFLFEQAQRVSRNPFGRLVTRLELPRTRQHEARLLRQFERVLVTSPLDRAAFQDLERRFALPPSAHPIHVLPNGVDLDYFQPIDMARDPYTIILTGKMSYHANVTAALHLVNEVMPRVWQTLPDARVEIVGQNPTAQVLALARAHPPRVQVIGTVADLRPHLARATLAVAPILYGAGIQNKVLEAMAMATPVVATSKAVAALSIQRDTDALVGDDPATLAQHIVDLCNDAPRRRRIGAQGRAYVETHHDWKRISETLECVYHQITGIH